MCDSLLGGGHDAVVGCDDDDGDVGDLCTTGTHGGECLVARCVEEGDAPSVGQCHVVCTDVLGDTACLTRDDIGLADVVKQRGLTVVDMTHDSDDRRAELEVALVVGLLMNSLADLCADVFGLKPELIGHDIDGLSVESLVDRYHDTHAHAGADDFHHGHVHHCGQLADCHELGEFQHLALCACCLILLHEFFLNGLALLFAVFGALLVLCLRSEACQRLFYLACHILLVYL